MGAFWLDTSKPEDSDMLKDNTVQNGITTETLANSIGCKSNSIRVRLCETGSFHGIRPHKLPNGRLLWPADAVQQLIERGAQ